MTLSGIAEEVPVASTGPAGGAVLGKPSGVYDSTFTAVLDGDGAPTSVKITTLGPTVSFDTSKSDLIGTDWADPRLISALTPGSFTSKVLAVSVNPTAAGLNYQTFGAWAYGDDSSFAPPTGGAEGADSYGVVTAGSALPASGQAKLSGLITAEYVEEAGQIDGPIGLAALLTVDVDFAARTASLNSSPFTSDSTQFYGGNGQEPGTDLHGVLTYAAGQNDLSGTLTSSDGSLSGGATARFYGPSAQELGGVFTLQSTAGGEMVGAFGVGPTAAPPSPNFSTWSVVGAPATITLSGIGQEQLYSDQQGLRTVGAPSNTLAETLTEQTDASGDLTQLVFQDPSRTVTFDTASGNATISKNLQMPGFQYAVDGAGDIALVADAKTLGWNYQTFGVWETEGNLSGSSFGTVSAGSVTPANAIPSSGTATFDGQLGFVWGDTTWAAGLTVDVDFGARTASLTSGVITQENLSSNGPNGNSIITGALTFQPNQNALTGTVSGSGNWAGFSGSATARFYGPAAQELGGFFVMGQPGTNAQVNGAFGAAKSH